MDLRTVGRYDALLLTAGIWFLAKFLRYAFPPLFEPLQATYGVSNAAVGFAFTGFMGVYALMQFPSGVLADRLGSVRVITAGAALAAVGSFALVVESPVAPFAALATAMLVMGAGTGAHKTVAVRLLSNVYPSRTGRALGALDTLGALGGVAAPAAIAAVLTLGTAAWRGVFAAAGVVGLALAFVFYRRIGRRVSDAMQSNESADETGSVEQDATTREDATTGENATAGQNATAVADGSTADRVGVRTYLAPFKNAGFSTFVVVTICYSFAYNGAVAFLPLFLTHETGVSPATASLLYGVLFAASLAQLVTGEIADVIGPLPVVAGCLALAGTALATVVALTTVGGAGTFAGGAALVALAGAVLAVGLGAHGFRPVRDAHLVTLIPAATTGGTLGVVRTTLMGAGAASPAIVGVIADTAGFRPAFALLATSFGLGSLVATVLLLRN